MFVIIGIVVVLGSMIGGYLMHHGDLAVLIQPNEFVIIGGVAFGSMIIANPISVIKKVFAGIMGTLKGASIGKDSYIQMMQALYELFQFARREGLIALEPHVEDPHSSNIISKYPKFLAQHHAVEFLCDTLKVILSGGIPAHDLDELMELDLETVAEAEHKATSALITVSDAFPGIGIVAAVLGVIITMGSINAGAATVGANVAAALVGTFLGILLSYGIVGPLAKNMENIHDVEHQYMMALKAAMLSFAKGAPAAVAVEYARRAIEPSIRPTFKEAEEATKAAK